MFSEIIQISQKIENKKLQKLHLFKGQLFQGRIIKFFPNNIASLQLGNRTVTAKLEAPLSAGQKYWLEVVRADGIPQLKILDHNALRQGGQQSQVQILHQLGIQSNRVNDLLIRHFATQQIPFTKEIFQNGAQLLQQIGLINEEGLKVLSILLQKNFPLTQDSFQAIREISRSQRPLLHHLNDLLVELQKIEKEYPSLHVHINRIQAVIKETQLPEGKHPFIQLLHLASSNVVTRDVNEGATQLLHRLGIIDANGNTNQLFSTFKGQLGDLANQHTINKLWPSVLPKDIPINTVDGKTLFQLLFPRLGQPFTKVEQQQQLQLMLQLFMFNNTHIRKTENIFFNLQLASQDLSSQERVALTNLWNQSVLNERTSDRSTLTNQMLRIITGLGYLQEREIGQLLQAQIINENSQEDRLKRVLLQLKQMELSQSIKDKVDLLLNRITGQQLIAQEQQGPLQHTTLQIPLQLGEWQTDLSVQWEGKRDEEGKIDSDHCRILFYLNLEQLKETIVDVQIQNRIISVQVLNEHERPNLIVTALQPLLKKKLSGLGFTLSNVKWVRFKEQQFTAQKAYTQRNGYEGVDMRI
ncbi:hypothetical protein [Alkalihalobacterium elongatum]|uniref:hypothetical protein n=1 Tax=Alkalihalobacterium elongatum TaxID=2675466 RepID=UPI001C1F2AFB|nr:hypothetical protein [Alkalihalobacterium elongatum]